MNELQPMTLERPDQFPTMEQIEKWFESKYCGIDKIVILPGAGPAMPSHQRLSILADCASPNRKQEWLRRDGNEAWYGLRIALVHSVWNELHRRHLEVVNGYEREIADLNSKNKADHESFDKHDKLLRADIDKLREGTLYINRELLNAHDVIVGLLPLKGPRKVVASLRALLETLRKHLKK